MAVEWIVGTPRLYGMACGAYASRFVRALAQTDQLRVIDLGRIAYADALALQRETHERLVSGRDARVPMTVFLLEHDPPVVTVTKRVGAAEHVLASDELLARHGIERVETDRGGDVTYHGPGQLVAYPILDLQRLGLKVHPYVRWLEQCVIDTIAAHGLAGARDASATGVWVGQEGVPERKIAAIGVRLSRFASLHGFALNVAPDLAHFGLIVPCGLQRPVTSMAAECAGVSPSVDEVKSCVAEWFEREITRLLAT
jgi:lipoate-protein ligase B